MTIQSKITGIVERWKIANPLGCHMLGIHEYDGILPDYTDEYIQGRIKEIKEDKAKLNLLKKELENDKFAKFEFNLVLASLERELFELDERKEFQENPLAYVFPLTFVEGSFTKRSFAPHQERVKLIIKFGENIPDFISSAFNVLKDSLPVVKIFISLQFLEGVKNYYNGAELADFVQNSEDPELIKSWQEVNAKVLASITEFIERLKTEYMPRGHQEFKLGKEKYMKLLFKQEHIEIDFERLLKVGEDDLESNYQKMKDILESKGKNYLEKLKQDYPDPSDLINYVQKTLDRTKQFIINAGIVTLPTDEQCKVIETPEFARKFAFAAMNTPGPFEVPEANEAYYYVTPPDSSWPEEKQEEHMSLFNYPFLECITIHEAWPGHYLQLLFNKQSKSEISKMFAMSTSMIEGWGHYVEQMVVDEGYEPFDKDDLRIGQLLGALVRNCRYVASIKMHCMDMSVEEAKQLFIEKGFISEENAMIEARRGTVDPMYLNYTLGKLLILKLRDDMKVIKGDSFSLKEFHNTLLSYGSPPITVLRELLLEEQDLIDEIL